MVKEGLLFAVIIEMIMWSEKYIRKAWAKLI